MLTLVTAVLTIWIGSLAGVYIGVKTESLFLVVLSSLLISLLGTLVFKYFNRRGSYEKERMP